MPLAPFLALAFASQDTPYRNENLDTMVQQSAVLLYNKIAEMNSQDLQSMTASVDTGLCLVGGILKPGEFFSLRRPPSGSDYHYLIAAANHKGATIAFRIKDADGKVVRTASSNDADYSVFTTVRESQGRTNGIWSYDVVNTAKTGAPIFASVLCTRSGNQGIKFNPSSLYECLVNLSKGVGELKAENYGFKTGMPVIAAIHAKPNERLVMGPYDMSTETAVLGATDSQDKKLNLYLTNIDGDIYEDAEDQGTASPYAILSGKTGVRIRLLNTDSRSGFISYAVMKPL